MIKKVSIKDQVYETIKNRILQREYKLGEQITIAKISEEFGISNTPIREALVRLEAEGLVRVTENTKYNIITLSEKELIELNEAVHAQLVAAVQICVKKDKIKKLIEQLSEAFEKHKELYESKCEFNCDYIGVSINFDRKIVESSENQYLINIFNDLANKLVLCSIYNKKEFRDIHYKEHYNILESIKNGDFEKTIYYLDLHFNKDFSSMDL